MLEARCFIKDAWANLVGTRLRDWWANLVGARGRDFLAHAGKTCGDAWVGESGGGA